MFRRLLEGFDRANLYTVAVFVAAVVLVSVAAVAFAAAFPAVSVMMLFGFGLVSRDCFQPFLVCPGRQVLLHFQSHHSLIQGARQGCLQDFGWNFLNQAWTPRWCHCFQQDFALKHHSDLQQRLHQALAETFHHVDSIVVAVVRAVVVVVIVVVAVVEVVADFGLVVVVFVVVAAAAAAVVVDVVALAIDS